jgi:hypothetical protein
VTPQSERITNKATELFFRYHPAVFKMKTFELLIKDEQYQSAADAEKRKLLSEELKQLDAVLARYRTTGAGPSGSASLATKFGAQGGVGRGSGRGTGGGLRGGGLGGEDDFLVGMSRNENDRFGIIQKGRSDALREYDKIVDVPRSLEQFKVEFLAKTDRAYDVGRMNINDLEQALELSFLDAQERFGANVQTEEPLTRQIAATDMYYELRRRRPNLLPAMGPNGVQLSEEATQIIAALDRIYGTDGFILQSFQSGREPAVALDAEKKRVSETLIELAGFGPGAFESRAQQLLGKFTTADKDSDKDGVVTAKENEMAMDKAMAQARQELGIGEPLSEEEALMLSRFTSALADDGVADPEELGADFDAAQAAYEKGRRAENLPRGTEVYYDDTYLGLLGRRAELSGQSPKPEVGTPIQRAAGRMVGPSGLPDVTPEALAAAAAVSPLAAEALPYAMARFTNAGGVIRPQSEVERKAQRLLDADPNRRPGFNEFVAQVNKMYPDDTEKRREAFAYYGAYLNGGDLRMQTTDEARLAGQPPPPPPPPPTPVEPAPPAPQTPAAVAPPAAPPPAVARPGSFTEGLDLSIDPSTKFINRDDFSEAGAFQQEFFDNALREGEPEMIIRPSIPNMAAGTPGSTLPPAASQMPSVEQLRLQQEMLRRRLEEQKAVQEQMKYIFGQE